MLVLLLLMMKWKGIVYLVPLEHKGFPARPLLKRRGSMKKKSTREKYSAAVIIHVLILSSSGGFVCIASFLAKGIKKHPVYQLAGSRV